MKKSTKELLIKGTFNKNDAEEILNNLFSSKIKYHTLSAFSHEERNAKKVSEHTKRKEELTKSLKNIMKELQKKLHNKEDVKIDCSVKLSFVKQKK